MPLFCAVQCGSTMGRVGKVSSRAGPCQLTAVVSDPSFVATHNPAGAPVHSKHSSGCKCSPVLLVPARQNSKGNCSTVASCGSSFLRKPAAVITAAAKTNKQRFQQSRLHAGCASVQACFGCSCRTSATDHLAHTHSRAPA
jgi:hypothetical protein